MADDQGGPLAPAGESVYWAMVQNAREGMALLRGGFFLFVNPAICEVTGWPRDELLARPFVDLLHPEDRELVVSRAAARLRGEPVPKTYPFRVLCADGRYTWVEGTGILVEHDGAPATVALFDHVSERLRAEEALRIAQFSIDHAVDAVFWFGRAGTVLYANEAAARLTGYARAELQGLHVRELEPGFDQDRFERWWSEDRGPNSALYEGTIRSKTGHCVPVEMTVSSLRYGDREHAVVSVRDITERKRAEEAHARMERQLRQQQKLESIGTLASGVAHEINNPVNVVMNYAELILARADQPDKVRGYANEIIAESQRIASIVRNLLAFSRMDEERLRPCRPADVVGATLALVEDVLRKDQIVVRVDVPGDLPRVRARSKELQQVFMNLIANARDALNDRYPGHHEDKVLSIVGREIELDLEEHVRITVEDRGTGIPEEAVDRVFDPFFTSKSRDKGTGLGLSVSHGIVKDHGGALRVESEVGRGSRFHVDLPASPGLSTPTPTPAPGLAHSGKSKDRL